MSDLERAREEYAEWLKSRPHHKVPDALIAALQKENEELQDEIAKVHHWLLEMYEFFWHDGNSRTHLSIINWLEEPHGKKWDEAVKESEGREMRNA